MVWQNMSAKQLPLTLGLVIFSLACLFYGFEYILRVAPSVMVNPLMAFFRINATTFGTLSAFYFYAYTPMQLVVGIIVDRYSIRHVLVVSIFFCVLGCLLMGITHSLWVAALGRFLQGFGSAFAFVGALKIASIWLPANRFAWYTGINNTIGFLFAGIIGEVALNQFLRITSWQMSFIMLAIIGLLLGCALSFLMRHKPDQAPIPTRQTLSLQESFAHFRAILNIPNIWLTGLIAALLFLPTSVFASLWGIPYLQKLHHYTQSQASFANSMIFVGWAIGSSVAGILSDKLGKRTLLIRIGAFCAFGLACLLLYVGRLNFISVSCLFMLFGMASSVEILTFVLARDYSPHKQAIGTAIAFVNMLSMIGGMLFQAGLGKMLDLHSIGRAHQGMRYYSLNDFQHAMIIIPLSLLLAFLCSFMLKDYKSAD